MSDQKILGDLHSATSSPESADGAGRSSLPGGVQRDQSGLEVRHASHSQPQEKEREKTTSGISGQSSSISSASASLQQSLVSRLQQLSDTGGSTIYKLTLKEKVTPQQRQYYQLGASAPRTKGTGSFLPPSAWPTPTQRDYKGGRKLDSNAQNSSATTGVRYGLTLDQAPQLIPWPTPTAATGGASKNPDNKRGINGGNPMATAASLVPWPTPAARDGKDGAAPSVVNSGRSDKMAHCVHLLPWATPNTMDHMALRSDEALLRQATVARKGRTFPANLREQVDPRSQEIYASGTIPKPSTAETESTAPSQLNPRFSLWLMGYPIEWAYCAERVMPSSRKRQRKS